MHLVRSLLALSALSLTVSAAQPRIHRDYASAYTDAEAQGKYLLIQFQKPGTTATWPEELQTTLAAFVRAELPLAASATIDEKPQPLLDMPAFAALGHAPGLALVNLKDRDDNAGCVPATMSWGAAAPTAAQLKAFLKIASAAPAGQVHIDQCGLAWLLNYSAAYAQAEKEKKLLLVVFETEQKSLNFDRAAAQRMRDLVLVRLPVEASDDLLSEEEFRWFHRAAGVGIVDLKHEGDDYGRLVQVLPADLFTTAGLQAMIAVAEHDKKLPTPVWHTDYHKARAQAEAQKKMLLIAIDSKEQAFKPRPASLPLLFGYVLLRQTTASSYKFEGQSVRLLDYEDFYPLRDQAGLVIYDFLDKEQSTYGEVVSVMPYQYLTDADDHRVFEPAEREQQLLSLEPNSLSQRTLTWAIRVSRGCGQQQRLRSADGRPHDGLMAGATRNSQIQCYRGCGHYAGGISGGEIASPGSGQDMVDGALNMIRIWCSSAPHYRMMVRYHWHFGYDMVANSSYHWYGTGRF